jgi:two-component system cell cycle sensor histidine kinase/response regulator CckA
MVSQIVPVNSFNLDSSDTSHETDGMKSLNHPSALIVEDEFIVAEDLRTKLQSLGFTVTAVTASGREAIECAKVNYPDLVLMDCRILSDLNGPETAVIIQGLSENPVPVVFLTAYSQNDYPLIRAVEPYLFLQKPFTDIDLKETIEKAVRLRLHG